MRRDDVSPYPLSRAGGRSHTPVARRWDRRRLARAGVALALAIVLVLVLAQLVLPLIAAQRVRDRLRPYGSVHSVSVHAVPALELLWEEAEKITVSAGQLRISPHDLVNLEQSLSGVTNAELTSPGMDLILPALGAEGLPLHAVQLTKHESALTARGSIGAADVHTTLPGGFQVKGLSGYSGLPEVGVSGEVFGVSVSGHAVVRAREGKIVAEPRGIPFASLATITLFSDPRLDVESVSASPEGEAVTVTIQARQAS
jgi:hypothetical protein